MEHGWVVQLTFTGLCLNLNIVGVWFAINWYWYVFRTENSSGGFRRGEETV
jgi:hypothetical protein